MNTTAALGTNATFSCRGDSNITWEINGRQIRDRDEVDTFRTQLKVYVPLPKPSFSELIFTASTTTNCTSVVCLVGPRNGPVNTSEEVKILAYGKFRSEHSCYLSIPKMAYWFVLLQPVVNSLSLSHSLINCGKSKIARKGRCD